MSLSRIYPLFKIAIGLMLVCLGLMFLVIQLGWWQIEEKELEQVRWEQAYEQYQQASLAGEQLFEVQCRECHGGGYSGKRFLSDKLEVEGERYFIHYVAREDSLRKAMDWPPVWDPMMREKGLDHSHHFPFDSAQFTLLQTYLREWESSAMYQAMSQEE